MIPFSRLQGALGALLVCGILGVLLSRFFWQVAPLGAVPPKSAQVPQLSQCGESLCLELNECRFVLLPLQKVFCLLPNSR